MLLRRLLLSLKLPMEKETDKLLVVAVRNVNTRITSVHSSNKMRIISSTRTRRVKIKRRVGHPPRAHLLLPYTIIGRNNTNTNTNSNSEQQQQPHQHRSRCSNSISISKNKNNSKRTTRTCLPLRLRFLLLSTRITSSVIMLAVLPQPQM